MDLTKKLANKPKYCNRDSINQTINKARLDLTNKIKKQKRQEKKSSIRNEIRKKHSTNKRNG